MTCSICGKATGPGAMLCRPCRAALKRARQFTVQALPGTPIAVTGPGDAFPVSLPVPHPRRRAVPGDRPRRIALAVLAVALLAAAAFVAGRGLAAADMERATPALVTLQPRPALPPPQFAVAAPDVVTAPRRLNVAATARTTTAPPAPAVEPSPPAPPDTLAQAADAPRVVAAPAAAPAPPDRWQAVSDALARCADEGGLSGFLCDRRVRQDACDGYWGRMPQCPAPSLPANPR